MSSLPEEKRDSLPDVPRYTVVLFVIVMALHLSSPLWVMAWKTGYTGDRLIGHVDSPESFYNVNWDDFCYIARINAMAEGDYFSDPWNNHNPEWKGWGPFGFMPPFIGGTFLRFTGSYLDALVVWSAVNFITLGWLLCSLFRGPPFSFRRDESLIAAFVMLSVPWFAAQSLKYFGDAPNILFYGLVRNSLTRVEAGLFTYLPYVLFLWIYWRWAAAPNVKRSLLTGMAAGFLGYFYFFHYAFAFLLLAVRGAISLLRRQRENALMALVAIGFGIVIMLPVIINNLSFELSLGDILYHERLDFSPGRIPSWEDYRQLQALVLPLVLGLFYGLAAPPSPIKKLLLGELPVIAFAYAAIIHLRLLLGFMQAEDHFWRFSLGIPASLWSLAVIVDLVRSRRNDWQWLKPLVFRVALVIPLLLPLRTALFARSNPQRALRGWSESLSAGQNRLLEKVEAMGEVLRPGDGFISTDVSLNYHVMVNLRAKPFVALGLSPVPLEEITGRYLAGLYLTGGEQVDFPEADRSAPGYFWEKDPQLYLYVNIFQTNLATAEGKGRYRSLYSDWDGGPPDWSIHRKALGNVRAVYVDEANMSKSVERLGEVFLVEEKVPVGGGAIFKVRARG